MKVFVTTWGSYSDYCIDAVFSTRELAEAYLVERRKSGSDTNDIEEYELDGSAGQVCTRLYEAEIDLETGEIYRENNYGWLAKPGARSEEPTVSDFRHMPTSNLSDAFGRHFGKVRSLVSQDHARKLAAELRQETLRAVTVEKS